MFKVPPKNALFVLLTHAYIFSCYGAAAVPSHPQKNSEASVGPSHPQKGKDYVHKNQVPTIRRLPSFQAVDEITTGAIFLNVIRALVDYYVDPIGPQEMKKVLEGAVQGALSALDPHSGVVPPHLLTEMSGEFGGLGVQLLPVPIPGSNRTELTIMSVLEGTPKTPAQLAGLKPKDVIVSINNTFYERHDQAIEQLRGAPGSKVSLNIRRKVNGEDKFFQVLLTRAIIKVDSVKFRIEPNTNIGYIRIGVFDAKTSKLVADALREIYRMNSKVGCIILDLRDNYGGYLEQAIKVANFFIPSGIIVKIKDRKHTISHKASPQHVIVGKNGLYDTALLVLVNGQSASASELLASALKDHKRAIIVGQSTFGKGSVQEIRSIDQSNLAFKFTTSRFYSPNGSPIQGAGVVPDVILKPSPSTAIGQKIEIKEANLSGSLEPKTIHGTTPAEDKKKQTQSRPWTSEEGIAYKNTEIHRKAKPEQKDPTAGATEELDYELLQAMDLAKALSAQFNQFYDAQKRERKK